LSSVGLLLFHRLFEAEAFTVHFKDFRMMSQPVQERSRHAFALEDLTPVAEGEVACDEKTATFVAALSISRSTGKSKTQQRLRVDVADGAMGRKC